MFSRRMQRVNGLFCSLRTLLWIKMWLSGSIETVSNETTPGLHEIVTDSAQTTAVASDRDQTSRCVSDTRPAEEERRRLICCMQTVSSNYIKVERVWGYPILASTFRTRAPVPAAGRLSRVSVRVAGRLRCALNYWKKTSVILRCGWKPRREERWRGGHFRRR